MINTTNQFHALANAGIRPLDWKCLINFTGTPEDLSTRATGISVSRSFDFPYNVQSAIADVSLDNHDGYLSFVGLHTSPIADYILPNLPIQIRFGFKGATTVPNFTGYTEAMPTYDGEHDSIAKFTALDKLAQISEKKLPNMVMMKNARTDEVLAVIFQQIGLSPSDYKLEGGKNVIPFVYFDSDKDVGNALKELIQAEDGKLWQDEEGVIRFKARSDTNYTGLPAMEFNKSNVISISPSRESGIYNQVNIKAEIRQIEGRQQVFLMNNDNGYQSASDNYRVPANGQATFFLSFDDPVWSCTAPTLNGSASNSNFTAVNLSGNKVNSGLSVVGTLFATAYKVVFTNTNASPVSIKSIALWGEPAKMIGGQEVEYSAYDSTSVAKFGTRSINITDNKCFGSVNNLVAYANAILESHADYSKQITMSVKGDPALQLGDAVKVSIDDFEGNYIITSITNKIDNIQESRLETELKLQYVNDSSTYLFTLNKSKLNGTEVLG